MDEKRIREDFKLRLAGVEDGNYSFSVCCNKEFFELAEIEEVLDGQLDLRIEMVRHEKLVTLSFHFDGEVTMTCDRCLLPVNVPMSFASNLIVKLVPMVEEGENDDDDDIWVMDENTYELDVFHYVYETILLALPHKVLHEDDPNGNPTCDPSVMAILDNMSSSKNEEETDPRWDALKNLKFED
ncbi:MAG: DUF177 domain-containing protein [Bacteroidales bacterium]|nr:DUF177 domain-containing protein [Bacteroidales bacterium]